LEVRVLTVKSQAFEKKKDIIGSIRALDDGNQLLSEGQDKLLSIDSEINLAQMFSKMGNRYRSVEMYPASLCISSKFNQIRYKRLLKVVPAFPERVGLMSSMYKRAGEELRMLGKTKQSITMFKKAFMLHKSKDDYHGQAHSVSI
jgi:hypothetical protein